MNTVNILNTDAMHNKESDTSELFEFQLIEDEKPTDLSDATVNVIVKNGSKIVLHRAVEVVDALEGKIAFRLTDEEYIGTGYMQLEFVVVFGNGVREIYPQKGSIGLKIEPRLKGDEVKVDPDNPTLNMEYLQTEIVKLKSTLDTKLDEIAEALKNVNGGGVDLSGITTQLDSIQTELEYLSIIATQVDEIQTELTDLSGIKTQVEEIQTELEDLSGITTQIGSIQTELEDLNAFLGEVDALMDDINGEVV